MIIFHGHTGAGHIIMSLTLFPQVCDLELYGIGFQQSCLPRVSAQCLHFITILLLRGVEMSLSVFQYPIQNVLQSRH